MNTMEHLEELDAITREENALCTRFNEAIEEYYCKISEKAAAINQLGTEIMELKASIAALEREKQLWEKHFRNKKESLRKQ